MKVIDILSQMNYLDFVGDSNSMVDKVVQLNHINNYDNALSWCKDDNLDTLKDVLYGTVIVSSKYSLFSKNIGCNFIVAENPRRFFMNVVKNFFTTEIPKTISRSSVIGTDLPKNVFIGEHVVIEKGCTIGENVSIQHNTVVYAGTVIGNNVNIGANCTIGGVGFGYEKDDNGLFQLIPHLGNVVIKDNVDIGNNTAIDRAVMGSTILEENCKVDNLVHIAHGVRLGKNVVVIANAMIAGSVVVEDNAWISPSASILNQKKVGTNSVVGMGAVVVKNVNNNEVVAGNPSKLIRTLK